MSESNGHADHRGRLTAELAARLVEVIRAGHYRNVACKAVGISTRLLESWVSVGKKDPYTPEGHLLRAILEAESAAEIDALGFIARAAKGDWKAAAWWLARKFPERWGDQRSQVADQERRLRELEAAEERRSGQPGVPRP